MELYLFRHGIAEDRMPGHPDSSRQLTEEGRKKTALVAKMARASGVKPSLIISSPFDRAMQTAEAAAKEFGYEGKILQSRTLVPDGSPHVVWNELRNYPEEPAILLAGHEPLLSQLTAHLLSAPSLQVEMKKSAMVRIDIDSRRTAPQGVLRWMIVPALAG
ncbi:MAG TPA: phosphohistidine phosphatase SixA [Bryobacteraceae bacterium]|jgi:phosphohistidine phosphatase|nr:phosphohistidine phosphatase SixA [Bryobacteraceae bacterium]